MCQALLTFSENESLLRFPPQRNPWLIGAILLSFAQHFVILYVTWFNGVFGVAPLSWAEWQLVLAVSFPVIVLDEVLKLITRNRTEASGTAAMPNMVPRASSKTMYSALPQEAKAE